MQNMNDEKVISRILNEIEKIDKKKLTIYFFVFDSKGNPNGDLNYIYNLALILKNNNYNVAMLYQDENDEFDGVEDWLGDEYSQIPHYNIKDGDVSVSASDILFIPELFSNIMMQTKKLPCKRIVILQNYDFAVEQTPISAQWGDFGIIEAITNSDVNAKLIKNIFPYIKTTTITPFISKKFGETNSPKKLIINVISKNQNNINKVIKPFYWKYPMYKWISFRDVRGFSQDKFSEMLRESPITIWIDEDCNFGYSPLEAIKSGSIVIAKIPNIIQDWMVQKNSENLNSSCIWFDSFDELHKLLSSVIRAWITDNIPSEMLSESKEIASEYTEERTRQEFITYIESVLENRKNEMQSLITYIEKKEE